MHALPHPRPHRWTLPAAGLALAFAAPASVARSPAPAQSVTAIGPVRTCIPLRAIRETRVRDDRTIDFLTTRDRGYRVTLDRPCPQLGFERAFTYRTSLSQLCAQDIITVLIQSNRLIPGASCGLAPFQPVTLARPPR